MKLIIVLVSLISSVTTHGKTPPGFSGCGEYLLKGVLIKNHDKKNETKNTTENDWRPVVYKVNGQTNSRMEFTIKASEDLMLISSYLNRPTDIKVNISKLMDGTKGEIEQILKVSLRKSNPLVPLKNSGIFLVAAKACRK